MKFSARTVLAISLTTVSIGCGAPQSATQSATHDPFIGDWKLSPSRGAGEPIALDGTDQPGFGGTTLSVTVEGSDAWRVVRKKAGRLLITATWRLSQDGNTLSDDYTEFAFDGQVSVHASYQYHRTADGQGFAGTWESPIAVADSQSVTLQIRPYGADGLSLSIPSADVTENIRFDGKDYPVIGRGAAEASTASARQLDNHTLEVTSKTGGTIRKTEHIELSPDLKTLTKTARPVGQREPNIFVFERQALRV